MRVLSAEDVEAALPMDAAIAGMRRAFAALASGGVEAPGVAGLPPGRGRRPGVSTVPVRVRTAGDEMLGVRIETPRPGTPGPGRPAGQTAVLLLDPATGHPEALLEGEALGAIRTGATSAVATDLLARRSSRTLAVLGTGVQARTQVLGVCRVRPIETVRVYGRDPDSVRRFAAGVTGLVQSPVEVVVEKTPGAAVGRADVVCTATSSSTPVFADRELRAGVHINGVGSVSPSMAEIPHRTIARALLVVDDRGSALAAAGDVIQAIEQGAITADHIHGALGELLLGRIGGRSSPDQVTVFKSVGLAMQDVVAASLAYQRAASRGIGREVRWR